MALRDDIVRYVRFNEGSRNTRYFDSLKIPTIGVGFNLNRPDAQQKITALGYDFDAVRAGTQNISDAAVDSLLSGDIDGSIHSAETLVATFDQLNDARKAVVVDMIFNLGATGFAGFSQTIAALESGDFGGAATAMANSHWATQVGARATRDITAMSTGTLRVANVDAAGGLKLGKEGKDTGEKGKDGKDAKEGKEGKEGTDKGKEGKDNKEGKEGTDKGKEGKDNKEGKDGKDSKDDPDKGKDGKDGKDDKEGKDGKESSDKGKDGKDSDDKGKDGKDGKDSSDKGKEGKDGKDSSDKGKDGKDSDDKGKDGKDGKDSSDKGKEGKDGKDSSDKGKDGKDSDDKGKDGKDSSDKDKDGKESKDNLDVVIFIVAEHFLRST